MCIALLDLRGDFYEEPREVKPATIVCKKCVFLGWFPSKDTLHSSSGWFSSMSYSSNAESAATRWCQNEAPHDAPANVLSKGLVDFLKENQAWAGEAALDCNPPRLERFSKHFSSWS